MQPKRIERLARKGKRGIKIEGWKKVLAKHDFKRDLIELKQSTTDSSYSGWLKAYTKLFIKQERARSRKAITLSLNSITLDSRNEKDRELRAQLHKLEQNRLKIDPKLNQPEQIRANFEIIKSMTQLIMEQKGQRAATDFMMAMGLNTAESKIASIELDFERAKRIREGKG